MTFWFKFYQFSNDSQNVRTPFFRWNVQFDLIRKQNQTNLIIVVCCGKSHCGRNFGNNIFLELIFGTKTFGTRNIDHQHHRQFAFFLKNFDVRLVVTSCHIPVNRTNVIAILVRTHFAKSHSATFERGVVFPRKDVIAQSSGFDFYFSYFF